MKLSIVIPSYNEEQRISRAIRGISRYFDRMDCKMEVIVVCDGCTDNTAEVAQSKLDSTALNHRIIEYEKNRGKGGALKVGMLEARGEYRLFTDADLSTPIEALDDFWPLFERNLPVIFGSRKCEGAEILSHQPWIREQMGKTFTWLSNLTLGTNLTDFTCGLKAFRADVAENIFSNLTIEGWAFDAEIAFLADIFDYPVKEVPVAWRDVEGTKVNPLKEMINCTYDLIRIRLNGLRNVYERKNNHKKHHHKTNG